MDPQIRLEWTTWRAEFLSSVVKQNREDVKRHLKKLTDEDVSNNTMKMVLADENYLRAFINTLLQGQINREDIADILMQIRCPLHRLVTFLMDVEIFESMIIKGADLNEKDANGRSALSLAFEKRLNDKAIAILRSGADVKLEELDLLHPKVIHHTSLEVFELLLTRGVDVNTVDRYGNTLLHVVISDRNQIEILPTVNYTDTEDVIFFLLERGARFHMDSKCAVADKHWSPDRRLSDAIDHLIDCEMTPDEKFEFFEQSIEWGWLTLVKSFLKRQFDINKRSKYGCTPLHCWAPSLSDTVDKSSTKHNKDLENVVRLSIYYGADVTLVSNFDDNRGTILSMALRAITETYSILEIPEFVLEEEDCKMINPLVEEIVRLDYHGIPVNEFDLLEIKEKDPLSGYYKDCVKELELMRSRMFYKKISLYDVLNGVNTQRLGHLQNTHSIERFNLDEYRNEFPIYSKMLTYKSNEILLSQRLTRQASVILNSIFSSVIPIEVIIHNVIVYLNFNEMKIITEGYQEDYNIRFDFD